MQVLCNDVCKDFTKLGRIAYMVLAWLASLMGMKLVHQEATVLPKGWLMFDPALAKEIGINPAIIFQTIDGWVQHNLRHNKNIKKGRAWSYNTIPNWGSMFGWLNPSYVGKLIRDLEKDGRLLSAKLAKHPSDQTKYYSTAAGSVPDSAPQQMSLWPVENMTLRGRKAAHDSSIGTAKDNPSKAKKTNTNTRAGATMGGVGVFPNHIPGSEPAERKAEIPEGRLEADEHEPATLIQGTSATTPLIETPFVPRVSPMTTGDESTEVDIKPSEDTTPIDVPEWANQINEPADVIAKMFAEHGDELTGWYEYGKAQASVTNPVGLALVKVRQGVKLPVKASQEPRSYHQEWMDATLNGPYADFIEH